MSCAHIYIEFPQAAQRCQHQRKGLLCDRDAVGAWHVAHRDAARFGMLQIDGVDAHANLLHESQLWCGVQHRAIHGAQAVPQHFRAR